MKNKTHLSILFLYIFCTLAIPFTYAEVPISGTAYGENIGLVHFDYSTSIKPTEDGDSDGTPDYLDIDPIDGLVADIDDTKYAKYYIGEKKEFLITPWDEYYTVPSSYAEWKLSKVNDFGDATGCNDVVAGACLLHGFAWSDTIGWIVLDGSILQNEIGLLDFDAGDFGRIEYDGDDAILRGYIWSENTGWIKLSSDTMTVNEKIPSEEQNKDANVDKWGVWIDTSVDPVEIEGETLTCDGLAQEACLSASECLWDEVEPATDPVTFECKTAPTIVGRAFHGNAWSERLGWIKFDKTVSDTSAFDFGVYSMWIADSTAPVITAKNHAWFANESLIGAITWPRFAEDPESSINWDRSELRITSAGDEEIPDPTDTEAPIDMIDNPNYSPDFINCESVDADDIFVNSLSGNRLGLTFLRTGLIQNVPAGFCKYVINGTIVNGAGLTTNVTDHTFYVRAGNLYEEDFKQNVSITNTDDNSAIADGVDSIEYSLEAMDIAGNSIVPVKVKTDDTYPAVTFDGEDMVIEEADSADWIRDVQSEFTFNGDFSFNGVATPKTDLYAPVLLSDVSVPGFGSFYGDSASIIYPIPADPQLLFLRPSIITQNTEVQIAAFAPNSACGAECNGQSLQVTDISVDIIDSVLYPVSSGGSNVSDPTADPYLFDKDSEVLGTNVLADTNLSYLTFSPAITLSNGGMFDGLTNTPLELVTPGQPLEARYTVTNNSLNADIGNIAIDHNITIENVTDGFAEHVLAVKDITVDGDNDSKTGRTDHINVTGNTFYEIFRGTPSDNAGSDSDASITVFHPNDGYKQFSPLSSPLYNDWVLTDVVTIGSDGSYTIDDYCVPEIVEDVEICTYPEIDIDRSDYLTNLLNLTLGAPSSEISMDFQVFDSSGGVFTNEVKCDVDQYVAYRMPDALLPHTTFNDFAIYFDEAVVEGVEIKRVGLQATGVVTGGQVYESVGGREFDVISATPSANLKSQMRDNAAEITRNINALDITGDITVDALEDEDSTEEYIRIDNNSKTIVAVYEGSEGDVLQIGSGPDVTVPAGYKYTIVVKGGADLFIAENIVYGGDSASSLGIIVLSNPSTGIGGNVYVSPGPTNIVGLLYAEGSLISSSDGVTACHIAQDCVLKNQLYWKGSIVSVNTIGGAGNQIVPDSVDCGTTDLSTCAQVYDMDFIRRFSVKSTEIPGQGYSSSDSIFSGGGTCTGGAGTCSYGVGSLDSCITITGSNIDLNASKSIDPFFVEKSSRPAPPGFTAGGGFESTIQVR